MPSDPYTAGAGMLMGLGGTILGGLSANRRRKEIEKVANMPGLDFPTVYRESLGASQGALPMAGELAGEENRLALEDLQSLYETSIPGYGEMQRTRAGTTASLLRGELPSDVASQVYRGSTARALEGGYGGSPAWRNLVSRDLGLTSLNLINMGGQQFGDMVRTTPMPRVVQPSDLLNISASDVAGQRAGERSARQNILLGRAASPTDMDVWAKYLQDSGGAMTGAGGGFGSVMNWGGGGGGTSMRGLGSPGW